ncbi:hypothetical protein D9M71_400550 [compost metagenome]
MIAFHRTALNERQQAGLWRNGKYRQLVGRTAVADVQELAIGRHMNGAAGLCRSLRACGQFQHLALHQSGILIIEDHHLGAHLQCQVGVLAIGPEHQMPRAAARRQGHCRRVGCSQWAGLVLRVETVDEHLVGAQVTGKHVTPIL